jgi:hypothetical protein
MRAKSEGGHSPVDDPAVALSGIMETQWRPDLNVPGRWKFGLRIHLFTQAFNPLAAQFSRQKFSHTEKDLRQGDDMLAAQLDCADSSSP